MIIKEHDGTYTIYGYGKIEGFLEGLSENDLIKLENELFAQTVNKGENNENHKTRSILESRCN